MRGSFPVYIAPGALLHPRVQDPLQIHGCPAIQGTLPLHLSLDLRPLGEKGLRHLDRATLLLLLALEAVVPPLLRKGVPRDRLGLFFGTAFGGLSSIAHFARDAVSPDPSAANPGQFQETVLNAPMGRAMIRHGLTGATATFSTSVIAAADALGAGLDSLRRGRMETAVVGGFDALEDLIIHGASTLGWPSTTLPLVETAAALVVSKAPPVGHPPTLLLGVETRYTPGSRSGAAVRAASALGRSLGWGPTHPEVVVTMGPQGRLAGASLECEAGCLWDASPILGEGMGADAALAVLGAWSRLAKAPPGTKALALVEGCGFGAAIALERDRGE